jgi:putative transposase
VANKCPRKYFHECLAHVRQIYLSPSVKMARKAFRGWERTWRDRVPRAVRCLVKDIDDLLRFLQCPVEHHRIIRTTNVIERPFQEFRRRLKPMGTFPDMRSCKRLILAQFQYYNHRRSRRCNPVEEIALTYKWAA